MNGATERMDERGTTVMAVLHPSARGPLPKISPLLVGALRRSGWTVVTTSWGGRDDDEGWATKVIARGWELLKALARLATRPGALLFVNTAHSSRGVARDLPLVLAARALGHGTLVLWHGSGPDRVRARPSSVFARATACLCRCSDAVLVLSRAELHDWRRLVPGGQFVLVANPFEPRRPPIDRRGRAGCSFLFVGRLMKGKGVYELLEAFAGLYSSMPDCSLTLAGDGPEREPIARWVDTHGLSDAVDLAGYIGEPELTRKYVAADVFVLPSYAEGFPTVISEAMDAGLPIVATACGGMVDHLEDGVNCLFVRPRDARDLQDALARLADDEDVRLAMGAANRSKVREFAPDVVVAVYDEVLQVVAARHAPSGGRA